jgi:predicted nuclease of restriction endonuclease-like (RecB) superfamily
MNYYNEIKENLINNEVYKAVKDYSKNKSDLETYYKVGKLLSEAGKHYGEGIIKEYSIKLTDELGKKYNITTLKRIRQFYLLIEKGATLSHQLLWSQYVEILPLKDIDIINYYIKISVSENLSVRELRIKIKSQEYERLPKETKIKLINQEQPNIKDLVPNPIVIKNKNNIEIINEKLLHQLILENIFSFISQLGNGYSIVGSEYKIKVGNQYNFIDLLLFNYVYNCFVVVEFKITELKKEHIGQVEVYMNYVDKNIKKFNHDKTIGIIIVKKNNKFVMEYCSDPRIIAREYIIK